VSSSNFEYSYESNLRLGSIRNRRIEYIPDLIRFDSIGALCRGFGDVEGFEEVAQVAGPETVEVLAETSIEHWAC
jgi:hypothetical protein